jgi:hypothetical protein
MIATVRFLGGISLMIKRLTAAAADGRLILRLTKSGGLRAERPLPRRANFACRRSCTC